MKLVRMTVTKLLTVDSTPNAKTNNVVWLMVLAKMNAPMYRNVSPQALHKAFPLALLSQMDLIQFVKIMHV